MFNIVKGFKKEDLKVVAEEIGEIVPATVTVASLKKIILDSKEYAEDPDFVQNLLVTTIEERKLEQEKLKEKEERERKEKEERERQEKEERERQEKEREREHELELARIQAQTQGEFVPTNFIHDVNQSKRKFTLPKLEFRQFGDNIKDWLPFWSQFEQIHNDAEIALEDKFQYLIQATIAGSRAREVVESFPPIGANYAKAIESLKTRFGREDMLVEVYVRELLKLIISVQTKERFSLISLYDKLESYLRALETLGVTTDKCASILYPMVESCFPADFLKAWNRTNVSNTAVDAKERLNNLMNFLKTEVEGEERISLAVAGFGLGKTLDNNKFFKKKNYSSDNLKNKVSTAAGLLTNSHPLENKKLCIFCEGKHRSSECFSAQKMSLAERQKIVRDKRCCFACLAPGHAVKNCRTFLKCMICSKKHVVIMCGELESKNKSKQVNEENSQKDSEANLSNFNKFSSRVFLQTLKAKLISDDKIKTVRLLFDSASHKSYILKRVAEEMNYQSHHQEKLVHSLFGGLTTKEVNHNCYKIRLRNLNESFRCNFDVLDQITICENIRPVCKGSWVEELEKDGIVLSDVGDNCEVIEILIGADVMGKLLTGRRKILSSGLVAVETHLGWTLMGKVPQEESCNNLAMTVTSLLVSEAEISYLWRLDLLGINDPVEKKSRCEIDRQTKDHFLETVTVDNHGRYEVCLPWADDTSPLPDNCSLAKKRLDYTTSKLLSVGLFHEYEKVFKDWLVEGIIEEVPQPEINSYGNYLPHRPIIKPSSSTTPIRPVFDASARLANHPSLNQCLQCGPNLIEFIPDLLLRFRENRFGVTADIRKAFLQISIRKEDRDFLRFLWWENLDEKKLKVFRHSRVVFGVKCSPFLLASVIEYHIDNSVGYDSSFKEKLKQSFYVDNVVTSVENRENLEKFIQQSTEIMSNGCFDLRQWEYSGDCMEDNDEVETHVLGLIWNKRLDTLRIDIGWISDVKIEKITKRSMLSTVHKIFDPFGFTCPVMLCPKIMLQKAWKLEISWDEEITGDLRLEFLQWFKELSELKGIEIPRFIFRASDNLQDCTLHTFVDGSKDAYAAVVFLRIEKADKTELVFLAAKSRVAPLRGATIPRMELLAAVIGTRLANSIIEALDWKDIERYYWTDSTTVLAWILREENWSVFVRNRVQEIRKLSNRSSWKHISSDKNAADLPSRGCRARQLISLRWWEGPTWMKDSTVFYNIMNSSNQDCDEEEIEMEKLKTVNTLTNNGEDRKNDWYYKYFSRYEKIVCLVAWILRFKYNCLNPKNRRCGQLTAEEFKEAEAKILLTIQKESFVSEKDEKLKTLEVFKDDHGLIRLKTKLTYRKDTEDFITPIILPSKHEVVKRLIMNVHITNCHAGVQILLNILREKYWIINGRKSIRKVISKCTICKRYKGDHLNAPTAPLPENRVSDSAVFEVVGVDLAGPLMLKGRMKAWICLFTCAVYRAIHLELVSNIATEAFFQAFRRFISRRGRPRIIYCDNGKNFVGASNALKAIDWDEIVKRSILKKIEWRFNPPSAPWWGGWWERLVGLVKQILRKVLGKAYLSFEEMTTTLCDTEAVINSRPLTYISESDELIPLSPSLFLRHISDGNFEDFDEVDMKSLNRRLQYRYKLMSDLRERFRNEYLGLLIQQKQAKFKQNPISVGEVVLIGCENVKRLNWPLGRVIELIPGSDKVVRLARIKTASSSELLRPIQRIFPLEVSSSWVENHQIPVKIPLKVQAVTEPISEPAVITDDKVEKCIPPVLTRKGRLVKKPVKLNL